MIIIIIAGKNDEARERDLLRMERHKERARERNLARAAPDKRLVDKVISLEIKQLGTNSTSNILFYVETNYKKKGSEILANK